MSGFLHRLAAGVLHPQHAIHPSVGTIWSAAGMTEAPGSGEPIESSGEVLVPPPRRADAPAVNGTRSPPERSPHLSDSDVHKHTEQPAVPGAIALAPLVAPSEARVVSKRPLTAESAQSVEQTQSALPSRKHSSSPQDADTQQSHRIEPKEPLVPPRISSPRMTVPAMAPVRRAPPIPLPSERPAHPAGSPAEERDAIEIHIGRIEVLATLPRSAPPTAPARARKSLDLEEYLRGDRRSR